MKIQRSNTLWEGSWGRTRRLDVLVGHCHGNLCDEEASEAEASHPRPPAKTLGRSFATLKRHAGKVGLATEFLSSGHCV